MQPQFNFKARFFIIIILLFLALCVLGYRIVRLMLFDRYFLEAQGNERSIRVVTIPAYRGMILDRNGKPLAISVPVQALWVEPKDFQANKQQLTTLATILNTSPQNIQVRINKLRHRDFVYLARELNPTQVQKITDLQISGLHFSEEFRRFYPLGEVSAQIVGLTNIDDQGQEGEELAYNHWLSGIPGKKRVLVDNKGHVLQDLELIKPAIQGQNLYLSIDNRIQFIAYSALKDALKNFHAKSGSVVVLDVNTGEVLAMANAPSYNPNDRPKIHDGRFRNRAVTDVFEPGSTIKAFSVANALASGKYTPTTLIDTNPGYMPLEHRIIRDDDNYGLIDVTQVLQKSSNIGVTKMTLSLAPDSLWKLLHNIGFGQITTSGFPGESSGMLPFYPKWDPFVLATMSFGYGLAVTDLQLAQAYATLAAGGIKHPVSLIKLQQAPEGIRIIPENIAHTIIAMLETVISKGGTATLARVSGYQVSGKTGTVRIVGKQGYEANHHIAIFVGTAPATAPRLVVSVEIKDPEQGGFYGGLVAAPVFAKVMAGALAVLNIPPDNITEKNS